jgi:DNA polymerase-1
MMSITRKPAKTMNFGLLYGMGLAALAKALKVDMDKARQLKTLYYSKLKKVEKLFDIAKRRAIERGYIFNSYGRRSWLDDVQFAYKLVNYLIQGTGADVVRHVMPKIDSLLMDTRSGMLIQAHDELVFEIHKDELHLIPEIKRLMEVEYVPFNGMYLTAGVSWSAKSWAQRDMIDGIPTEEDLRRLA